MLPTSRDGKRAEAPHHPADVNPYARWVYDHPGLLIADPHPAQVREQLAPLGPGGACAVDLGCGSGNFLLQLATQAPQTRFVGFELRYKRLVKAARKLERAGLDNVVLLRESAERCFAYFPPASLDAVYLNFPDPWPKVAQRKKRLVAPAFLARLAAVLREGGRFHFKTDHSGYFLHVLSLLDRAAGLRIAAFSNDLSRSPLPGDGARSEFEQLFRAQRKSIHCLVLEKSPTRG
jgi:tRNA (guanine-N7-)-methyltransferase